MPGEYLPAFGMMSPGGEDELASARTDAERLSRALPLGQFLLLEGKNAEYADLMTGVAAQSLLKVWPPGPRGGAEKPGRA